MSGEKPANRSGGASRFIPVSDMAAKVAQLHFSWFVPTDNNRCQRALPDKDARINTNRRNAVAERNPIAATHLKAVIVLHDFQVMCAGAVASLTDLIRAAFARSHAMFTDALIHLAFLI